MPASPRRRATSPRLLAEGIQYTSKEDWRRAAKIFRKVIVLDPDEPHAYFNFGAVLFSSGHYAESAERYLEAKERYPVGSRTGGGPSQKPSLRSCRGSATRCKLRSGGAMRH